jgi:plastocyanin
MSFRATSLFTAALLAVTTACGGDDSGSRTTTPAQPAAPAAPATAPAAGATQGEVIEVRMTMERGGRFEPAEINARPGDVIRFVNVRDVHNISWPAAKNPAGASLPPTSPFLTAPGQTHDVQVTMQPGSYTFQCDPHVPMGMVGTLNVTD